LCTIQDLQAEAERLGYAACRRRLGAGHGLFRPKIDAIVGEAFVGSGTRFPYMEAGCHLGVAIPCFRTIARTRP
jgi:hypothetical protein